MAIPRRSAFRAHGKAVLRHQRRSELPVSLTGDELAEIRAGESSKLTCMLLINEGVRRRERTLRCAHVAFSAILRVSVAPYDGVEAAALMAANIALIDSFAAITELDEEDCEDLDEELASAEQWLQANRTAGAADTEDRRVAMMAACHRCVDADCRVELPLLFNAAPLVVQRSLGLPPSASRFERTVAAYEHALSAVVLHHNFPAPLTGPEIDDIEFAFTVVRRGLSRSRSGPPPPPQAAEEAALRLLACMTLRTAVQAVRRANFRLPLPLAATPGEGKLCAVWRPSGGCTTAPPSPARRGTTLTLPCRPLLNGCIRTNPKLLLLLATKTTVARPHAAHCEEMVSGYGAALDALSHSNGIQAPTRPRTAAGPQQQQPQRQQPQSLTARAYLKSVERYKQSLTVQLQQPTFPVTHPVQNEAHQVRLCRGQGLRGARQRGGAGPAADHARANVRRDHRGRDGDRVVPRQLPRRRGGCAAAVR